MHTRETLKSDLARMGLNPEQTVLIHSSMRAVGTVENRADGVLDALMEYFAPGLLVFPTLTYRYVNAENPEFSVTDTPACTGILPELFRKRPGVFRSLHPTHSVAAAGKEAKEFIAGHENFDSPAHRNSPWGKLYDRNAVILFIGTALSCNTFLHGVEEWLPVPGMLTDKPQDLIIRTADNRKIKRPSRRHLGQHSAWYHLMEQPFRENDALKEGSFGDAHVYLLDARKAGDTVYSLLKKQPLFFTKEYQEKC
jgi:aminoglycoside 3-N-acetyltransferase